MNYRLLLGLLLVSLFPAEFSRAQSAGAQTAPASAVPDSSSGASAETTTATSPNYILSPNDLVDIRVFQEDDLRTVQRIPQDGTINFPLIGTVRIGGNSVAKAVEMIRSALQRDYLVNPQVGLTITQYAKRRFSIIGQVQRPGAYDIPDESQITLLDAAAMAGGYTRIANPHNVTVLRVEAGQTKTYKLDAGRMAKDPKAKSFQVRAGDTISVPESIF